MITAVDTNILLDILIPDAPHGDISEKSLTDSLEAGSVIIAEAVYTELSAHFSMRDQIDRFLKETGIYLCSSSAAALYLAGVFKPANKYHSMSFMWKHSRISVCKMRGGFLSTATCYY